MSLAEQKQQLTYDEFLAWCLRQERERYEYVDGEIVSLPSEGLGHNLAKLELVRALQDACEAAGFSGTVCTDGMQIRTRGGRRGREPDASVSATPMMDRTAQVVPDPLIVVEVVSPSSERVMPEACFQHDTGDKLDEYFELPSLQHYLVVRPEKRLIVHYARGEGGALRTTFVTGTTLRLDPPGLVLDLTRLHKAFG